MNRVIISIMAVVGLSLVITPAYPTSALTYQNETDVEFTINPTISVSLSSSDIKIEDLAPGSSKDSNIVTVSVSTNAGYGYYLSATAGTKTTNTDLTNTADSTYKFTNLSSNVASLTNIPDNNWGYSYSTDNGTTWVSGNAGSTTAGYNGLPLDNNDEGATGIKLISSNAYAASGSVRFKIGAKASSTQPAGTYTNTVNFYAVANPKPEPLTQSSCSDSPMISTVASGITYMQDINSTNSSTVLSALTTDATYQIKDNRDNETYCVGKLADGKLWLLDNLALDLTDRTILNSLSSSNTNIDSNNESAILTSLKSGNRSVGDQYSNGPIGNLTEGNSYSVARVNMDSKDIIPNDTTSNNGGYKIGGYYNFCAASAGSYCYGDGTTQGTSSGDATSDICPKGWRMPTGNTSGEYSALANAIYGSTGSTSDATAYANYRAALRLPLSGSFLSGSVGSQGSEGSFWSSTRYGNLSMIFLSISTRNVFPVVKSSSNLRYDGYSVRCVVK